MPLSGDPPGVVLAGHVTSQDWRVRTATQTGRVTAAEFERIRAVQVGLIG